MDPILYKLYSMGSFFCFILHKLYYFVHVLSDQIYVQLYNNLIQY